MSVEQKWIFGGLLGVLLLLLFPPFFYPLARPPARQWHCILDSRYTASPVQQCAYLSTGETLEACMKEKGPRRTMPGQVDVVFLLLELTLLGVGFYTGYYMQVAVSPLV